MKLVACFDLAGDWREPQNIAVATLSLLNRAVVYACGPFRQQARPRHECCGYHGDLCRASLGVV